MYLSGKGRRRRGKIGSANLSGVFSRDNSRKHDSKPSNASINLKNYIEMVRGCLYIGQLHLTVTEYSSFALKFAPVKSTHCIHLIPVCHVRRIDTRHLSQIFQMTSHHHSSSDEKTTEQTLISVHTICFRRDLPRAPRDLVNRTSADPLLLERVD